MRKACKICRTIIQAGNICPNCKSGDTTSNFQGSVIIFDTDSEIAKKLGIEAKGKYAIKV